MAIENPLSVQKRAAFAVNSRLLSCLVTEAILRAFYVAIEGISPAAGVVVILTAHMTSEQTVTDWALHARDILAIVPVHHSPVLKKAPSSKHGESVALLDPLDMSTEIYELSGSHLGQATDKIRTMILDCLTPPAWELGRSTSLVPCSDPTRLWAKFAAGFVLPLNIQETIAKELKSSYEWQLISYENSPRCPDWNANRLAWEQSLVSGHPTHPMHRTRVLPFVNPGYNWYHPRIRFAAISRSSLEILGPFEHTIRHLAETIVEKSNHALPDDKLFVIVPVHELQIDNIISRIPEIDILHPDISIEALAQSSIRTVVVPGLTGMAIKLSIGVKISSALRTITRFSTNFGPRFSEIIPRLTFDREILTIEEEPASAVYRSTDPDISKHLAVILRAEYQPHPNETVIMCAALVEMDHLGSPPGIAVVQHTLQLDSQAKRVQFLDQYIHMACLALLPPLIYNGVVFEAHAQNLLVRFDKQTKAILGFVVRDLAGLRIHPPTLRQSTGVDFQFLPGHCVATETLEETFPKFYHTFIHTHLQRLIRVLDLHYNGIGWELLRKHLKKVIPIGHALEKAWLDTSAREVLSKCLMKMRMQDTYRVLISEPHSNMIHFRPVVGQLAKKSAYSCIVQ